MTFLFWTPTKANYTYIKIFVLFFIPVDGQTKSAQTAEDDNAAIPLSTFSIEYVPYIKTVIFKITKPS